MSSYLRWESRPPEQKHITEEEWNRSIQISNAMDGMGSFPDDYDFGEELRKAYDYMNEWKRNNPGEPYPGSRNANPVKKDNSVITSPTIDLNKPYSPRLNNPYSPPDWTGPRPTTQPSNWNQGLPSNFDRWNTLSGGSGRNPYQRESEEQRKARWEARKARRDAEFNRVYKPVEYEPYTPPTDEWIEPWDRPDWGRGDFVEYVPRSPYADSGDTGSGDTNPTATPEIVKPLPKYGEIPRYIDTSVDGTGGLPIPGKRGQSDWVYMPTEKELRRERRYQEDEGLTPPPSRPWRGRPPENDTPTIQPFPLPPWRNGGPDHEDDFRRDPGREFTKDYSRSRPIMDKPPAREDRESSDERYERRRARREGREPFHMSPPDSEVKLPAFPSKPDRRDEVVKQPTRDLNPPKKEPVGAGNVFADMGRKAVDAGNIMEGFQGGGLSDVIKHMAHRIEANKR